MIIILFLLLSTAMILAGFGFRKSAMSIFTINLLLAIFTFWHLMTSPINIQL